jgi:hypothetical protein
MSKTLESVAPALKKAGFTVKMWRDRMYLKIGTTDAGYLTADDLSGATGTCRNVTRRSGTVAEILRGVA